MRAWTSSPPMMSTFGCQGPSSDFVIGPSIKPSLARLGLFRLVGRVVRHRIGLVGRGRLRHITAEERQHRPKESKTEALMADAMNERRYHVESDARIAPANAKEPQREQDRSRDAVTKEERSVAGVNFAGIELRAKAFIDAFAGAEQNVFGIVGNAVVSPRSQGIVLPLDDIAFFGFG